MKEDFFEILSSGANDLGISLSLLQKEKFSIYKDLLKEWNERMNLTSIVDDGMIALKHFVDSISICSYINKNEATLIDVGTGAGFPALPVKIVRNDVNVTLLDSLGKRIKFLTEVVNRLELSGVDVVHARAEDKGMEEAYREKFDYVCARAVAPLRVLSEYCLPFVKVGGVFIAMKGSDVGEIDDSKNALNVLGGRLADIKEFCLPKSNYKRSIVLVEKTRGTPRGYPRKSGKPKKLPL